MITQPTAPLLEIRDSILTALTAQQARRKGYSLDEWIAAERDVMLTATNAWRIRLNKQPVTEEQIRRVERLALGHDYTRKCALYCAELVMEQT
jgi:hypothetical protein